ncbi:MAG: tetratricopeptide repeat protein [Anaerolineaceae bacterium]|nr:tetratricopeptide repeat protein [Anaerolineaceae bacterium]
MEVNRSSRLVWGGQTNEDDSTARCTKDSLMSPNTVQPTNTAYEPLSKRELEILALMAQDLSDRVIAENLVVAYTTVKWYNRQIFNKLGVNNRHEAIEAARSLNLLPEQEAPILAHHNLPSQITPFVGRETELREVVHLLRAQGTRLVTILASGGMGKTRLSLAAAEKLLPNFPDGVTFVPLAALESSAEIVSTIATHAGYQFQRNGQLPQQQLAEFFSSKKALLVLDNFENLLDGAALVVDLLKAAPDLSILVTSREKLSVTGETVYTLAGLHYPDAQDDENVTYSAVELFEQCACRIHPSFDLLTSRDDVIQICRLVEGLPLAIELAAAWVEVLTPAEIVTEITASLDFLSSTLRDIPERQRSVRAVFDSTWRRLDEQERRAFMKLSVFRGGCTRRAAQTVAGVGLRSLTDLADKALIAWSAVTERYSVHELLRQYAAEALEKTGEAAAVRTAHSQYYGAAMAEREAHLKDGRQLQALSDITDDLDNVLAGWFWSLQQADDDTALQYARSVGLFYHIRSRYQEAVDILSEALGLLEQRSRTPSPLLLGWVLAWYANHLMLLSQYDAARAVLSRSLAIAREQGDRSLEAFCLHRYGFDMVKFAIGATVTEALAISRELNDLYMAAYCLNTLAVINFLANDDTEAYIRMTTEARDIRREIGDSVGLAISLNNLADAHQRMGKWDDAERYVLECLDLHREAGAIHGIGMGLRNRIAQLLFRHDLVAAEDHIREGLTLARQAGHRNNTVAILYETSLLRLLQGNYDEARAFAEEANIEALRMVTSDQFEALYPRVALGCAMHGSGNCEVALPHLMAGLPYASGAPADNVSSRYVLTGLACSDVCSGQAERALERLSVIVNSPLSPAWWATEEPLTVRLLADLRHVLPPDVYAEIWERGKAQDFDTVLENTMAEAVKQK